jgi:hypothetical protein
MEHKINLISVLKEDGEGEEGVCLSDLRQESSARTICILALL